MEKTDNSKLNNKSHFASNFLKASDSGKIEAGLVLDGVRQAFHLLPDWFFHRHTPKYKLTTLPAVQLEKKKKNLSQDCRTGTMTTMDLTGSTEWVQYGLSQEFPIWTLSGIFKGNFDHTWYSSFALAIKSNCYIRFKPTALPERQDDSYRLASS